MSAASQIIGSPTYGGDAKQFVLNEQVRSWHQPRRRGQIQTVKKRPLTDVRMPSNQEAVLLQSSRPDKTILRIRKVG